MFFNTLYYKIVICYLSKRAWSGEQQRTITSISLPQKGAEDDTL